MVKDKKVLPHLSSYANDPERIEEQANRMAKEGWILEKFGSLFSTYRRGKAGEYEYRVQVKEAGMDRLVYTAELAEFGIEEVGGVGDLLVLRKKADGTPFDLYSDLDSLIAQQKKAVRYLRAGLLLSLGWMSITLMNILTTLMNANVIGKYAGMAAINFRASQVFLLAASALLLSICVVGIIDCPIGLRRAVYPRIVPNERKAQKARSRARDSGVTRILQNAAARCRIALRKNKHAGGKPT